ncbi:MAG TPA: homocysteine S-methyltransferase family protein [Chitinophagales bacterium]|nr:homocysteine S-methyltransferase family protein [Chitinophagales bacterium]
MKLQNKWLQLQINILGGCCGTTPDHIRQFAAVAKNYKPRKIVSDYILEHEKNGLYR